MTTAELLNFAVFAGLAGLALVFFMLYQRAAGEVIASRSERDALEQAVEKARNEAKASQDRTIELERSLAVAGERARVLEERRTLEQSQLDALKNEMSAAFTKIGDEQLERSQKQLLALAAERFEGQKTDVEGGLDERHAAIDATLSPFVAQLQSLDTKINEMEAKREGAYQRVAEQLSSLAGVAEQLRGNSDLLRTETAKLTTSLRNSGTRGRWGEYQLRNIVELAGMNEYCDFVEQTTQRDDEGASRPDMTVRIPNGPRVAVDAKTPLNAYLDACEAQDDATRNAALKSHARAVLSYALELGKRDYSRHEGMADFTVMFVPSEAALSAALSEEPTLIDKAQNAGVMLVGPLSFIALLRAYAAGWTIVRQEQNSREIAQAGRELYKRLAVFAEHFDRVRDGLSKATSAYNSALGSWNSRLLPQAQKLERLGASDSIRSVPELSQVEVAPLTNSAAAAVDMPMLDEVADVPPPPKSEPAVLHATIRPNFDVPRPIEDHVETLIEHVESNGEVHDEAHHAEFNP
jgi:DNA recombination protein RmuC